MSNRTVFASVNVDVGGGCPVVDVVVDAVVVVVCNCGGKARGMQLRHRNSQFS